MLVHGGVVLSRTEFVSDVTGLDSKHGRFARKPRTNGFLKNALYKVSPLLSPPGSLAYPSWGKRLSDPQTLTSTQPKVLYCGSA